LERLLRRNPLVELVDEARPRLVQRLQRRALALLLGGVLRLRGDLLQLGLGREEEGCELQVELLLNLRRVGMRGRTDQMLALLDLAAEDALRELACNRAHRLRQPVERDPQDTLQQERQDAADLLEQDPDRQEGQSLLRDVDRLLGEALELADETAEV